MQIPAVQHSNPTLQINYAVIKLIPPQNPNLNLRAQEWGANGVKVPVQDGIGMSENQDSALRRQEADVPVKKANYHNYILYTVFNFIF